jgi:tetratricopeptide (TPR) repeat protein
MPLPLIYYDLIAEIIEYIKIYLFNIVLYILYVYQLIDPKMEIGDILTFFAIVISAMTLIFSLSKDRALREKENADKIRDAAAKTMAKLDRWLELSLSIFQDAQPVFIDTIEMLKTEFNKDDFDIENTRNYLWKNMISLYNEISRKILDEDLQTAHNNLFGNRPLGYQPRLTEIFKVKLKELQAARDKSFRDFIFETQENVLAYNDRKYDYKTNDLWNDLKDTAESNKDEYEKNVKPIFDQLSNLLLDIIRKEDYELLDSLKLFDEHYYERFHLDRSPALTGASDNISIKTGGTLPPHDSAINYYNISRDLASKSLSQHGIERTKTLKEALDNISTALNYDPGYCDAIVQKGSILYNLGDYNGALEAYDQAINIDKTSEKLRQKGAILMKMERYAEAIPILQESCDLDRSNNKARSQLERCFEQQMWHQMVWEKDF